VGCRCFFGVGADNAYSLRPTRNTSTRRGNGGGGGDRHTEVQGV